MPPKHIRYKDSPNFFNTISLSHSNKIGKVGYLFSLSRKESDGHRQRSAYEFYNLYGKFFFDLAKNRNIEFTFGGDIGRHDYPHSWIGNLHPLEVVQKNRDNVQNMSTFSTDIFYYAIPSMRVKYSSRFYFYRTIVKSEFNPDDPELLIPNNHPFGLYTRSNSRKIGNITQLDFTINEQNYLIAGLDIQRDMVDSTPDSIMFGTHQVNNAALYFQDEHTFYEKLTLTLGLRYDVNKLEGGNLLIQWSPKIALVWKPLKNWSWRLLASRAFRAPTIAERFFQKELSGGHNFKTNPDLVAETVVSFEVGNRMSLNSWANFDISYFHYNYNDMIFWENITDEEQVNYSLFQVRNLNKALIQGIEFSINFNPWKYLRSKFSYTYLDANPTFALLK